MKDLFKVIHEDDELLVIGKPAGLVCHPTKTDVYSSLISRVRLYLGAAARPRLVNRLDRETSGLTVVAKTDEVARELGRLWEERAVEKEYLAIVHGHVRAERGTIALPLGPDANSRVAIKDCVRPDGVPAETGYKVIRRLKRSVEGEQDFPRNFTLLQIHPLTGRKHQIRIHLSHVGHAIVGDKLYGGDEDLYLALVEDRLTEQHRRHLLLANHALHASVVRFTWRGSVRAFGCEPEPCFSRFVEEA